MRNRLERVNALPEVKLARGGSKLRDAIPSADELSSAVSRMNVAPWEDPFSLALGEASIEEGELGEAGYAPSGTGIERDTNARQNLLRLLRQWRVTR